MTAAYAGYPNASFVVNRLDAPGEGRLNADARVPLPKGLPPPVEWGDAQLHLYLSTADRCRLVWKQGSTVMKVLDVATGVSQVDSAPIPALHFPLLAVAVGKSSGNNRVLTALAPTTVDQAYLHVPNDLEYQFIVAAVDAAYQPKRPFTWQGKTEEAPAFNLTLEAN